MSGGKNGSVDDETGTWRSASRVFTADAPCPCTDRDWEGVGGGTQSTSPGKGSHCKRSLMIKDSGTTPNFQIRSGESQKKLLPPRVCVSITTNRNVFHMPKNDIPNKSAIGVFYYNDLFVSL